MKQRKKVKKSIVSIFFTSFFYLGKETLFKLNHIISAAREIKKHSYFPLPETFNEATNSTNNKC